MLVKIPISSTWQEISIASQYRNNINERIQIQSNAIKPDEDGIVLKSYESFTIPSDGNKYWVKTMNGSGELIIDPVGILVGGGSSGSTSTVAIGSDTSAGSASYRTITFVSAGTDAYQLVVTPTGANAGDFGEITVEKISQTEARVYNTGLSGLSFDWIVLK